jgi:hypothetical protein
MIGNHDTFMTCEARQTWTGMSISGSKRLCIGNLPKRPKMPIKKELLDLAAVCEEVANNIEDRQTSG